MREAFVKNLLLIIILACLSMLGAFSTDTYLPSFPSIADEFRVGLDVVQQTLTVYLLAMAVMTLFHGTLSDALGRRPIILGGLVFYVAASAGALFARSFSFLLFCRLVQGMFAGVGMVVGRAIIRDRFSGPEAQTVMSGKDGFVAHALQIPPGPLPPAPPLPAADRRPGLRRPALAWCSSSPRSCR